LYLYSGMADVAAETGDAELLRACRRLWESVTLRRMYVTGGIGSTRGGERFTFDYDLPNETAYAETCAAIALVFFSRRMSLIEADSRYADVMELALYNGVLSGVGLDGKSFMYANPLTVYPASGSGATNYPPGRQKWFDCACCPPNVARLLASLGEYVSSIRGSELRIDLYIAGTIESRIKETSVAIRTETQYPWTGKVKFRINPSTPTVFTLSLRVPGWCGKFSVKLNGKRITPVLQKGYALIARLWRKGDAVELDMAMPVEMLEANPKVRSDAGKAAFKRGPLVYCLEEVDNGKDLADLALAPDPGISVTRNKKFPFPGTVIITADARRRSAKGWESALYRPGLSRVDTVRVKAVPYALWGNRKPGEMTVWIRRSS